MATLSLNPRRRLAVVLILFLAVPILSVPPVVTVLHAADFLELHVSPILSDRGDMLVQVLVTRDAENQWMKITAESEGYYSSSEMELEGEYSPRVRVVRFRSVPAGEYEVTGTVYSRGSKVRGSARKSVLVFPR